MTMHTAPLALYGANLVFVQRLVHVAQQGCEDWLTLTQRVLHGAVADPAKAAASPQSAADFFTPDECGRRWDKCCEDWQTLVEMTTANQMAGAAGVAEAVRQWQWAVMSAFASGVPANASAALTPQAADSAAAAE